MKLNALVALASAFALAMALGTARAHTATRTYVAGSGDLLVLPDAATGNCGATPVSLGGGCFSVTGHTTVNRITLADASMLAVGGAYGFRTAGGAPLGNDVAFCGSRTIPIGVPGGAAIMFVWVDTALGPLDCPNPPGSATTGTITVVMTP